MSKSFALILLLSLLTVSFSSVLSHEVAPAKFDEAKFIGVDPEAYLYISGIDDATSNSFTVPPLAACNGGSGSCTVSLDVSVQGAGPRGYTYILDVYQNGSRIDWHEFPTRYSSSMSRTYTAYPGDNFYMEIDWVYLVSTGTGIGSSGGTPSISAYLAADT